MSPDILIVRDGQNYRVLHGLLRLAGALSMSDEVIVRIQDEGEVSVIRTDHGIQIAKGDCHLPLHLN